MIRAAEIPVDDPNLLTVPQAATYLGVAQPTVRIAIAEGRLPYVVSYGRKLVSRTDLDEYVARTRPHGVKPRGRPKTD